MEMRHGSAVEMLIVSSELLAQCFLRLPGALLPPTKTFFFPARSQKEIVVGETGVFLIQPARSFVPSSFEGEFGHSI